MPGSGLQEIMVRVYCLLIGCAFGLFQSAYFLGKIKGIDIRDYGSGNSGMTNTLRTLGTKAGLIVLVCDMLKIVLAVTLTTCLFAGKYPELRYTLKLYTAIGCIIGHNYPFYMRFRGGKGVAVTAGLILCFKPEFVPVGLSCFLIPWLTTHYVSLGSLCLVTGFFVQMIIEGSLGVFSGMSGQLLLEMYVLGALITGLCWFQHRGNIRRLIAGNERKTYLGKRNHATLSEEDLEKIREEEKKEKDEKKYRK